MKIIEVSKKEIDYKEFIRRSATEKDCSILVEEPCTLVENGVVKAVYDFWEDDTKDLVRGLNRIRYSVGLRSRGLKSTSRIFGYRPRNEMRQDYCSSTSMAMEYPSEHQLVCDLGVKLESVYQKYNPEGYSKHKEMTESQVKQAWKINGSSIFTSGIINKNNPLKYHFDTGNFSDVYSLMVVFKGGIEGGYLALPEYDMKFALPNNSILMFDGQSILHGVTPIKRLYDWSYRYSIVYYTLKRMWKCLEMDEEIARVRQTKTLRERTRMENPITEEEKKIKEKKRKMLREDRMGKQ